MPSKPLRKKIETTRTNVTNAVSPSRIAEKTRERIDVALLNQSDLDDREYAPMEVLNHRQHECIPVRDCSRFQDNICQLAGNTVEVELKKVPKNDHYNVDGLGVMTLDGQLLGKVPDYVIKRVGCKPGRRIAEIARPQFNGESTIELFLPKTDTEMAHEEEAESLKLWMNIDAEKWLGGDIGERADYDDVEILIKEENGKKPVYSLLGDNSKLLEFRPRMKYYAEIAERAQHKPRRMIAESRTSEYGEYYRVGLYF